jgi:hypothetical protein
VTNAAGTGNAVAADITIVPKPLATITAAAKVIAGTGGLVASVPEQDDSTYIWTVSGGTIVGGQGTDTLTYRAGAAGTATLKCVVTNEANTSITGSKAVTVVPYANISITTQPASQVVPSGGSVTFSVSASCATPLHYQWMKGATVVGTDSPEYTINPTDEADAGDYCVIVSNGVDALTSDPASLVVSH